jgi:hypothetical protein
MVYKIYNQNYYAQIPYPNIVNPRGGYKPDAGDSPVPVAGDILFSAFPLFGGSAFS